MENGALTDDAAAKVMKQVEFYFSDSNLASDRFLLRSIDESEDGLVSLAVICAFTRMRNHLNVTQSKPETIPKDVIDAVAAVLRKSSFLKVSDDGTRVGRLHRMLKPEEIRAEVDARSLAASPFPWNATREEVEAFFEPQAKIRSIRLPRLPAVKAFSGYAIVEFESPEEAQRVAALALNFKGADLKFQSKDEFDAAMDALPKPTNQQSYANRNQQSYAKGTVVSFKLTKIDKHSAAAAADAAAAPEQEPEKKENEDEKSKDAESKEAKDDDQSGMVIAREDIKAVLQPYGEIKFIDYSKGDTKGYVRFEAPEEAGRARTAAVISEDGGLVVKDHILTLEAVEGDAERDYWKVVREKQQERAQKNEYQDRKPKWGKKNNGSGGWRNNNGSAAGKRNNESAAAGKTIDATPKGKHLVFREEDDEPEPKQQRTE